MDRIQRALLFLTCSVLSLLYFLKPFSLNLDAAMYLQSAQLLLRGQKPYIDFIDLNPPLIFYFNCLPVIVSQLLHRPELVIPIFKITLLFFIFISLFLTLYLFKFAGSLRGLGFYIGLAFLLFCMHLIQNRVFGEREQMFIIAFFPYVFLRLIRYQTAPALSRRFAFLIGLYVAVAACLKPHFYFFILIFELGLLLVYRRTKPLTLSDFIPLIAVPLLYLMHFFILPADVRNAFFHETLLPLLQYYGNYGKPFPELLQLDAPAIFCAVLFCLLPFFLNPAVPVHRWLRVFSFIGAAALLHYFAQFKGWSYHLIPLYFYLFICAALLLWSRRAFTPLVILFGLYFSSCLYASIRIFYEPERSDFYRPSVSSMYSVLGENTKPGDFVMIVSPNPIYSYPALLQFNRQPGSRYLFHFPLSFFAHETNGPRFASYIQQLKEDLQTRKPALVVVVTELPKKNFLPEDFRTDDVLAAAGFLNAETLSEYSQLPSKPGLLVFKRHAL